MLTYKNEIIEDDLCKVDENRLDKSDLVQCGKSGDEESVIENPPEHAWIAYQLARFQDKSRG